MHHLGLTRSSRQADHILLTPDTFVRAPLPGMRNATAIVHASPAMGACFTQYTAELSANGEIAPCTVQRFVYVLEGEIDVRGQRLSAESYAYFPAGSQTSICSPGNARRRESSQRRFSSMRSTSRSSSASTESGEALLRTARSV